MKATVAKEVAEFERRNLPSTSKPEDAPPSTNEEASAGARPDTAGETKEKESKLEEETKPVGDDANKEQQIEQEQLSHAHPTDVNTNDAPPSPPHHESKSKAHEDEAEEVVLEDKEDTVIY